MNLCHARIVVTSGEILATFQWNAEEASKTLVFLKKHIWFHEIENDGKFSIPDMCLDSYVERGHDLKF